MINLKPRLLNIALLVDKCNVIADIGSDHGMLPAYILQKGIAEFALITDISNESLEKARRLIASEGLGKKTAFLCADGIKGFTRKPDTVIIAGMGGMEIISILKNAEAIAGSYILQPMKNADKLRRHLEKNNRIVWDCKVKDGGKFYDIIKAEPGKDSLTENEIIFGRTNLKEKPPAFLEFIGKELIKTEKITSKLDKGSTKGVHLYKYAVLLKKIIEE